MSKPESERRDADPAGPRIVHLAEYDDAVDREIIERWLAQHGQPPGAPAIFYRRPSGAASSELGEALAPLLTAAGETSFAPLRVVWLPPKRRGERVARLRDLLSLADPRHPGERRKRRLLQAGSDRWRVAAAEPATLSNLRLRWAEQSIEAAGSEPHAFARFIARQAELALERAEYRLQGPHYKVPRIVKEDITNSPHFRRRLAELAESLDRDANSVLEETNEYLHELRTEHSPFMIDMVNGLYRYNYNKAYEEIDFVPAEMERLRDLFARYPAVILPSHKANLDAPTVELTLARAGLPPPTTFSGINMAFWPNSVLMRKTGRVFLRRDIRSNPVYRFALREFVGHLVEKRFNLEWFPEGTRSRTGKLLPPKLGLLSYAASAYRQGRVEDLMLIPIAVVYDQAVEAAEFGREAEGAEKKAESIGWLLGYFRALRQPHGKAYLRVGEPISMRAALGPPDPEEDADSPAAKLRLQKLALSVAWQINRVTPITGIAVVAFALLATAGRAATLRQVMAVTDLVVRHAQKRSQPLTASAQLETPDQVRAVLGELIRTGVVSCFDKGPEPVYGIARHQHVAAAFYRNTMIHFVLERSIAELALLRAAAAPPGSREAAFWAAALLYRDILKFEFFFRERPAFEAELDAEMMRIRPDWREQLDRSEPPHAIHAAVFGLGIAHAALRSFFEAYLVVADSLPADGSVARFDERAFLASCLGLGRQYLLQETLKNPESVSKPLFQTGLKLARHRKLIDPAGPPGNGRELLAGQLRQALADMATIERNAELAMARFENQVGASPAALHG